MIRSIARVTLTAGLIAALAWFALRWNLERQPAAPVPPPLPTKWSYATEQEWIVAQVVKAIVNMTHYARSGAAADPHRLHVEVATEKGPTGLTVFTVALPDHPGARMEVTDHIWSPEMYAPLVATLLGPAAAEPAPEAPLESATFVALTRPRTDVMVTESRRVSSALATRMTDVAAHEDAALLFATLGIREWSGKFYDNHHTLGRLAAHLAMAAALRQGAQPGPSARIAEAALSTLAFRDQLGVLRRLDTIDRQPLRSQALQAWSRVLRMRNTEDWRVLPEPASATLIEQREFVVLLNAKRGQNHALEFLDDTDPDGLSDWGSILLSGGYTVEAGNRFVPAGLTQVLEEVSAMPLDIGGGGDPARLARALNEPPAPGPVRVVAGRTVVEVIDPGTWAAFAQRHLLHHVESGVDCMRRVFGMREDADRYRAQMERSFGALRQFPLASVRMAKNRAEHAAAMRASLDILAAGPEAVGGHNWNSLLRPPPFAAETFRVPPMESWLQPLFPAGTYFEWPKRLWRADRHLRVRGPALQQMHESLPYYSDLAEAAADDRLGHHPAAADLARAYGPLLDYDVRLMVRVANAAKDTPAEYERLYRRIGELDPDRLSRFADYLAEKGRKEEAAATYEQYVAKARDRVGVCNHVSWLVDYYEERGNRRRALELAKEAAQVYCENGLFTLADLYERRKEWAHAQEYYHRVAERYDDQRSLLAFYLRHQRAADDGRYRTEREALLARFFPKGMQSFDADPPGPPEDGVVLIGTSTEAAKAKLQPQDVIVSLNGFRVRDYDQYRVVRALSKAPELNLVVWRGRYLHIAARHPRRWFGVEVKSYKGPEDPERKYL